MVSLLRPLVDIAVAEAVDQGRRFVNFNTELSSLKGIVSLIEGVLPEAEEMQVDNPRIRDWLRGLDDICYDARDILDEFVTIAAASIRAKRASKRVKSNSLHSIFLRVSHPFSTVFRLRFRLANKIKKLEKRLDRMKMDMETVQLLNPVGRCSPNAPQKIRPKADAFPDMHPFVGREDEKEKIMDKLKYPKENHVEVVPIWGMGGVGKTALARSVYNDKRVPEVLYALNNRRWLSVGEKKFVAMNIISTIIDEPVTDRTMPYYWDKLNDIFTGRFFIVLDDVWDVDINEWRSFFSLLNEIRKGGLIIITTRTREVITATDTSVRNDLRHLSNEDCWKIFESHAFIDENSCKDLEERKNIGKDIVQKLKGLPIAAELVGRSLSSTSDLQTWRNSLVDEEWKQSTRDDDVMTTLKWSYNRLPLHLKYCFAYCSLFPKDHVFDEKLLVEIWMAHGLLESVEGGGRNRRPEGIGAHYFQQLVNASLLQWVNNKYVMHDLVHDLAIVVSNEMFLRMDNLQLDVGQLEKVRHLSFHPRCFWENVSLCNSKRSTLKKLLTLYTLPMERYYYIPLEQRTYLGKNVIQNIFKQLKSIRVLVLVSDKINYIPKCISDLIHLRYLDIEKTYVSRIPDTLCDLYNLQTLVAPTGVPVIDLPENIVNMTNLRHLRAHLLKCRGVRNLTSLQELHSISISEGDQISELGEMQQLRGKLTIKCLENVTSNEDAAKAMMQEKTLIDHLELEFTVGVGVTNVQTNVLDALQCPPNLRYLVIRGYNGRTCPSWMVCGKLKDPSKVTNVMRLLSVLHIRDCDRLVSLKLDIFVCLKHLTIENCSKLTSIDSGKQFINLQNLTINHCDSLYYLPRLDAIEELDVRKCEKLKSLTISDRGLNSLQSLLTIKCPMLEILFEHSSTSSASSSSALRLSRLRILTTDNRLLFLKMFEHDLISLREMCIGRFTKVKHLFPDDFTNVNPFEKLTLLETLTIYQCEILESLPPDIHKLSSLKKLWLHRCSVLQELPADGLPLSLELLVIAECPLLYERCQMESGADWDKITHIPEREIEQTISADRAIELAERFKFGG